MLPLRALQRRGANRVQGLQTQEMFMKTCECRVRLKKMLLQCKATSTDGFLECTRIAGHSGPHIACGVASHRLGVWRDKGRVDYSKPYPVDGIITEETGA